MYFWDKASECKDQGVKLNWSVLDPESLHAALANNASTTYCERCHTSYHLSSCCPFNLREPQSAATVINQTPARPHNSQSFPDKDQSFSQHCTRGRLAFHTAKRNSKEIKSALKHYTNAALAPGSKTTYKQARTCYLQFCRLINVPNFDNPPSIKYFLCLSHT